MHMIQKTKYPIDTASFRRLREEGYIYVDKTGFIHKLIETGVFFFLARPRRFGKSLLLDTLAEYFKGNKKLFNNLEITYLQPGEWKTYPVLRFNLSGIIFTDPESLINYLNFTIEKYENEFEVKASDSNVENRFENIISEIYKKTGENLVVLIDEYDAPLSATIDNTDLQEVYREQLHGFYSVLKKCDNYIRFCMLTGVTRYGKVSVFSGLNNLNDITFSNEYASICGITKEELAKYYSEGINSFAEKNNKTSEEIIEMLRSYYDGYHFSDSMVDIYNPYSINYAMYNLKIDDYWCRSGVPTLLSKSLLYNDFNIEKLNGRKVDITELSDLSMFALNPIPLFYQTGYLTLKEYESRRQRFTIGYPNREVEAGILNNILSVYLPGTQDRKGLIYEMEDAMENGNPIEFIKIMNSFLAGIPSKLHTYVNKYENYYHTVFYCLATLIGLDIDAEYNTSEGFIDLLIKTEDYIYIIELKINGSAKEAIKQIEEKHYASSFETDNRKLYKIGIGFSKETNSIKSYEII